MIPFMKLKWAALGASLIILIFSAYYIFAQKNGFRKGIDFSGGIKLEIELNDKVTVEGLRNIFHKLQIQADVLLAGKELENVAKVEIGSEIGTNLEKMAGNDAEFLNSGKYSVNSIGYLSYLLAREYDDKENRIVHFISASHVGPTVGDYLQKSALKLLLGSVLLITLYITFRFQLDFAVSSMISLFHVLFMTSAFIGVFQIPLTTPVIAALLTILGYTINDTVVVFDRIRENLKKIGTNIGFEKLVNISINETLTRSINTMMTTLLSIIAIYFIADEALKDMTSVLLFGIAIGTYSSNMIASPILVIWSKFTKKT